MIEVEIRNVPEQYKYLRTHPHLCADGTEGVWRVEHLTLFYESHDIFQVYCENCKVKETFKFLFDKKKC